MTLRTVVLASTLILSSLACSGVTPGTVDIPSVPLTAPWSDMKIPVDEGSVVMSDNTQVSVTYQGKKLEKLSKDYDKAITGAGWTKDMETEAGGAKTTTYKKDGKTLSMTVAEAIGFQTVSIIILDF